MFAFPAMSRHQATTRSLRTTARDWLAWLGDQNADVHALVLETAKREHGRDLLPRLAAGLKHAGPVRWAKDPNKSMAFIAQHVQRRETNDAKRAAAKRAHPTPGSVGQLRSMRRVAFRRLDTIANALLDFTCGAVRPRSDQEWVRGTFPDPASEFGVRDDPRWLAWLAANPDMEGHEEQRRILNPIHLAREQADTQRMLDSIGKREYRGPPPTGRGAARIVRNIDAWDQMVETPDGRCDMTAWQRHRALNAYGID